MKKIYFFIVALLLTLSAGAQTFPDWTSSNGGIPSSTSQNSYTMDVVAGATLTFDWSVSSAFNSDWLIVTIDGKQILKKSGSDSGSYTYKFTLTGVHTLVVKYTKDGGGNYHDDQASITNITLKSPADKSVDINSDGTVDVADITKLVNIILNSDAQTFPDWTSTNGGSPSSTSQNSYTIDVVAGATLTFNWSVSSESDYDWLIVTIDGKQILKKSGSDSGSYTHEFTVTGVHTLVAEYTKDVSVNDRDDQACITNVTLESPAGKGGDINSDGTVDVADITKLVNIILNGDKETYIITVSSIGNGTIAINGTSSTATFVNEGENVTITATPCGGEVFDSWYTNGGETRVSTEATYTFVASENIALIAKFNAGPAQVTSVAVDLGLPSGIKWASCNIGATAPEEYGGYYAWGETEEKSNYDWSTYKYCNGSYYSLTKYCTDSYYSTVDNKTTLEPGDDVAHVKWGGYWRMPTGAEQDELRKYCTWTWTTFNGVKGYRVIGPNGKSIFLPAAGYYEDMEVRGQGAYGYYWSSSLSSDYSFEAYFLYFYSSYYDWIYDARCYGLSVRPVCTFVNYTITVSSSGNGPVAINGTSSTTVTIKEGENVTITATAGENEEFAGWYTNGGETLVSTEATYTFIPSANIALIAKFNAAQVAPAGTAVDLGLSVKWASHNVGARKPEEYGGYYAWGETTDKSNYTWSTYIYCNGTSTSMTKYCTNSSYGTVDNKTTLEPDDDVAHVKWGSYWRMPTLDEIKELKYQCTWEWTTLNGATGYRVTGPNGNSIFLPATGYRYDTVVSSQGAQGYYWSSSLYDKSNNATYAMDINSDKYHWDYGSRGFGVSVRPVYSDVSIVTYTITVSSSGNGTVAINGTSNTTAIIKEGDNVTISATPGSNAEFTGWYTDGGETFVSYEATYTFVASANVEFVAKFNTKSRAIDLGLPSGIKWASCNVGATAPEEYGGYYAWGETEEKDFYDWSNYKYCYGGEGYMSKYSTRDYMGVEDHKTTLEPGDDVAHVKWGGSWRMPTEYEIKELKNDCTWTWTTLNGINGYRVTGPNGNSIFLPAAGYRFGTGVMGQGAYGLYWSSSLNINLNDSKAYNLHLESNNYEFFNYSRCRGFSVRPVCYVTLNYTITVSSSGDGTVAINGTSTTAAIIKEGDNVTITATPGSGEEFTGWYTDGGETLVSTEATYTFVVSANVALIAKFNTGEAIDLGLPSGIKWASCNVGATAPEEYGGYYAWGETEEKSSYNWSTYKYCNGSETSMTKYCTGRYFGTVDNNTTLEPGDDIAHVKWGGSWRMPTTAEQDELRNNCTWTWTTLNGVNGYRITGPNGNSIFLPAAGYRYEARVYNQGARGYNWSSSLYSDISYSAHGLRFYSSSYDRYDNYRCRGFSVRPVCDDATETPVVNYTITVSSSGNGTVAINGTSSTTATIKEGDNVTITATPGSGEEFTGWYTYGSETLVSSEATYTFVASANVELIAKFNTIAVNYTITVSSSGNGTVAINGTSNTTATIKEGDNVTITATPGSGEEFTGWYTNGSETFVSSEATYTFVASANVALIAKFNRIITTGEAIDLGLPSGIKWASCNVGATAPEEYGGYYAWGETEEKSSYDWSTYKYCNGSETSMTKYCTDSSYGTVDNKTTLEPDDDVAHVKWGGSWRMPTNAEYGELRNNCIWQWTTLNGVTGYRVTGPNGNSIFLPAAGCRNGTGVSSQGSGGGYWSSSLSSSYNDKAYYLTFDSSDYWRYHYYRYYGQSVRPVCE